MVKKKWMVCLFATLLYSQAFCQSKFNVPADFSSIQSAIDAASDGDTIFISDGTYSGDGNSEIDFMGKAITVKSINGPANCIITFDNVGIYFRNGEGKNSVISGVTIRDGKTYGIICENSSPLIENCVIASNANPPESLRTWHGGGISCENASPDILNCTIIDNGESGISIRNSSPAITDCDIKQNDNPFGNGGGIIISNGSSPFITNCLITDNYSHGYVLHGPPNGDGGGIYCSNSSPTIVNSTIALNEVPSPGRGPGIFFVNSNPKMINTIVWGNILGWGDGTDPNIYSTSSEISATHCDTTKELAGEGNISLDPMFVYTPAPGSTDATDPDFRLMAGSPCVDTGSSEGAPETDIQGRKRPYGNGYDMGAYEFSQFVVTRALPETDAIDVSTNTTIETEFSSHIDCEGMDESAIIVTSDSGDVTGQISCHENKVEFIPANALSTGTTYKVTVSALAVTDAEGNPPVSDYSWNFTTVPMNSDTGRDNNRDTIGDSNDICFIGTLAY